jgi:hypothetical protein
MTQSTTSGTETNTAQTQTQSVRERAKVVEPGQGIELTEVAAEQVKKILAEGSYPDTMYLFVGVKGGGCSGLQYILDLRDEAQAAP